MRDYTHVRVLRTLLKKLQEEARANGRSTIKQLEAVLIERYGVRN